MLALLALPWQKKITVFGANEIDCFFFCEFWLVLSDGCDAKTELKNQKCGEPSSVAERRTQQNSAAFLDALVSRGPLIVEAWPWLLFHLLKLVWIYSRCLQSQCIIYRVYGVLTLAETALSSKSAAVKTVAKGLKTLMKANEKVRGRKCAWGGIRLVSHRFCRTKRNTFPFLKS